MNENHEAPNLEKAESIERLREKVRLIAVECKNAAELEAKLIEEHIAAKVSYKAPAELASAESVSGEESFEAVLADPSITVVIKVKR